MEAPLSTIMNLSTPDLFTVSGKDGEKELCDKCFLACATLSNMSHLAFEHNEDGILEEYVHGIFEEFAPAKLAMTIDRAHNFLESQQNSLLGPLQVAEHGPEEGHAESWITAWSEAWGKHAAPSPAMSHRSAPWLSEHFLPIREMPCMPFSVR